MSTCSRCGLPVGDPFIDSEKAGRVCLAFESENHPEHEVHVLACRDRELANLRSLLRSVTGKLERVSELMDTPLAEVSSELVRAKALVDSVLEALS